MGFNSSRQCDFCGPIRSHRQDLLTLYNTIQTIPYHSIQYHTIQTVFLVRRLRLQPTEGALGSQFCLQFCRRKHKILHIFCATVRQARKYTVGAQSVAHLDDQNETVPVHKDGEAFDA